jgi:hypothetical protein
MVKNNNFNSVILDIGARFGIHPSFKNLKYSKVLRFAQILCLKHFYNLKWLPNQKIKEHKLFYEKVFNSKYLKMNKFNESLELNPL